MAQTAQTQSFYDKGLFKLISGTFPEFRTPQGVFSVDLFGAAVGMSNEGVYKWFRSNTIRPQAATKVIAASVDPVSNKPRITREQLSKFFPV